uniref:Uncharacterized protein n=1 Tax=Sus scrofa TaxID=9823 RepID=A0A8D1UY92_PIG
MFPESLQRFATWEDSLKHSGLPVGWWPWEEPDLPVVTEQGCGRSGGHPRPPTSSPGLCALPQVLVSGSRREARGPACAFLYRPQALSPVVLRAALVPVFSFGENDAFDKVENLPGIWLRWCHNVLKEITKITLLRFIFRGIPQHNFVLLPSRGPITTVVGTPIEVQKTPNPSQEEVDGLHQRYLKELSRLFEAHKLKYNVPSDQHLEFC